MLTGEPVGLPVVLPKMPAAFKLASQTRFRRPLYRRLLIETSQDTGMATTLTGYGPSPSARDADGTVRPQLEAPKDETGRRRRACAALPDARAARGSAARRAGDPVPEFMHRRPRVNVRICRIVGSALPGFGCR